MGGEKFCGWLEKWYKFFKMVHTPGASQVWTAYKLGADLLCSGCLFVGSIFAHNQVFRSRGSILRMRKTDFGEQDGPRFTSATRRGQLMGRLSPYKVEASFPWPMCLSRVRGGSAPLSPPPPCHSRLHHVGTDTCLWAKGRDLTLPREGDLTRRTVRMHACLTLCTASCLGTSCSTKCTQSTFHPKGCTWRSKPLSCRYLSPFTVRKAPPLLSCLSELW